MGFIPYDPHPSGSVFGILGAEFLPESDVGILSWPGRESYPLLYTFTHPQTLMQIGRGRLMTHQPEAFRVLPPTDRDAHSRTCRQRSNRSHVPAYSTRTHLTHGKEGHSESVYFYNIQLNAHVND